MPHFKTESLTENERLKSESDSKAQALQPLEDAFNGRAITEEQRDLVQRAAMVEAMQRSERYREVQNSKMQALESNPMEKDMSSDVLQATADKRQPELQQNQWEPTCIRAHYGRLQEENNDVHERVMCLEAKR